MGRSTECTGRAAMSRVGRYYLEAFLILEELHVSLHDTCSSAVPV